MCFTTENFCFYFKELLALRELFTQPFLMCSNKSGKFMNIYDIVVPVIYAVASFF